jgi:putative cell wall-binding protein
MVIGRRWAARLTAAALATGLLAGVLVTAPHAVPQAAAAVDADSFLTRPLGEAACPEGMARRSTIHRQIYESGIPESRFNNGWYRVSSSAAPEGSYYLRSDLSGASSDPSDYTFLPYVQATAGVHTRLAFATRGTMSSSKATVSVDSVGAAVGGSSSWTGRNIDITAATDDEGGWLGTWFEHRVTTGTATRWDLDNVQLFTCRAAATSRISGADRYATAAAVSQEFPAPVDTVYVARGDLYPDALSGAALAGKNSAPVLLVEPTGIPTVVSDALNRLKPQHIVVLGGSAAVSEDVVTQLRTWTQDVVRLGGADRFEVSAAVASLFPSGLPTVYVASGLGFADALSGAALAPTADAPVLLTQTTAIPDAVAQALQRLQPGHVTVLGGSSSVSDGVMSALGAYATGATPKVTRISGSDRYATSAAVAAAFPSTVPSTMLASGETFPDALAGAALAGTWGVPLLLTQHYALPSSVDARLRTITDSHGYVLGGTGSVASIVRDRYGRTLPAP